PYPASPGLLDRGIGDRDVASALGEQRQGVLADSAHEVGGRGDAVGGELPHALDQALAVGDRLGTDVLQLLVVLGRGGADHARAGLPCQLGGGEAHAAGGGVDQQRVVLAQLQGLQAAQGRQSRERQARGGVGVHAVRDRRHRGGGQRHVFGEGAALDEVLASVGGDSVTGAELRDIGTDL